MGKSDSNNAEPRRGRSRRRAVAWFLARWSMGGAIWNGFFGLLFLAWGGVHAPGARGRRVLDRLLWAAVPGVVRVRPAGAGAAQRAEAPAERHGGRSRRLADRELWRSLWRFGAAGRSAALSAGRRARNRGPAILQPLGR